MIRFQNSAEKHMGSLSIAPSSSPDAFALFLASAHELLYGLPGRSLLGQTYALFNYTKDRAFNKKRRADLFFQYKSILKEIMHRSVVTFKNKKQAKRILMLVHCIGKSRVFPTFTVRNHNSYASAMLENEKG